MPPAPRPAPTTAPPGGRPPLVGTGRPDDDKPPGRRIVVILDHLLARQFLVLLAQDMGLTVIGEFGTISEAKPVLERESADIVLFSWSLPDGAGLDLVRHLKLRQPDIRWLLCTARATRDVVLEAIDTGVHGLVLSGTNHSGGLREAITRLLAGHRYYCPISTRLLVEHLERK